MVVPIAPRLKTCTGWYCTETVGNCNTVVSIILYYWTTIVYAVRR